MPGNNEQAGKVNENIIIVTAIITILKGILLPGTFTAPVPSQEAGSPT
jgi:hypothetical protein